MVLTHPTLIENRIYMNKKRLAILLATYKGERFLQEQLDSIYRQTYCDWTLYIHDDGSTDSTLRIIADNAAHHDNIIVLDYKGGTGPKDNFLGMLQRVDADYYMFCDQDDVWYDSKIEVSMRKMCELEERNSGKPVVVHTDLTVVDAGLKPLHKSFWAFEGIHPEYLTTFERLAACNVATGCTMLFNNAAKVQTVIPAPAAHMHDAWVVACAMKNGGIVEGLPQPTIYYRQHGNNCLGASPMNTFKFSSLFVGLRQRFADNMVQYKMLKSLGYGSIFTYLKNKIDYRLYIQKH